MKKAPQKKAGSAGSGGGKPRPVDFFGPRYLAQYREELSEARTEREISFLKERLGLRRGMKVLDVGCGSGRHAILLAKMGCVVTGFDKNAFLLREAKRAADEAKVSVRFVRGDVRKMPFRGEFDAAVNLYTSFGYFSDEADHLKAMKAIARALRPGGKFFIDVANRDHLVADFSSRDFRLHKDGSVTLHTRAFDGVRSVKTNSQLHIDPSGKREASKVSVRLFSPHELVNLCIAAGLRFRELWGDFEPYHLTSRGIVVVAQKPKT